MMNNYYVRKVLDEEQIKLSQELLEYANKNDLWHDGLSTGGGSKSIKSNKELSDFEMTQTINNSIMSALDSDSHFLSFTAASTTHVNIISKTETGNYYNPHLDMWENGDFSTTVFLNSPDEYEGGELCLYFGNDSEKLVKLEPGWAITYPTGLLHRVNVVTSGVRYASVFWTKSKIKDYKIRNIFYQICLIEEIIEKENIPMHYTDCKVALKDPLFIINNLKNELCRYYGV
jgi:PKHD-type hydroxylase